LQVASLLGIVRLDDVGMIELSRRPNLAVEALQHLWVIDERSANNLDGHESLHDAVLGLVDDTHAAAS
jgi:hypothetical protein